MVGCLEELSLIRSPGDLPRQGLRLRPALGVQLAELRHGLLDDLAVAAHRTHQPPVRVGLAVLANRRVA